MKGIILAAGTASRLRPLTDHTPKCLLTVGEKSILQRTIDNLIKNSVTDLVVVTGYLGEQVEGFIIDNYPYLKVELVYNQQYAKTNNIYSLWLTKKFVVNHEILLLDSDIVFDRRVLGLLINSEYKNCLAVKSTEKLSAEEIKISLHSDNSIAAISKEVDPQTAMGESIGIEKFSTGFVLKLFDVLDKMILQENLNDIFYEAAFQRLIDNGAKLFPVSVGELKCLEIDFVEDFEKAAQEVVFMK